MAFHHLAFATNDLEATHRFYTEVMGFELAKVVVAPTPSGKGWAKHVFYDTGDEDNRNQGLLAFWELHDETIPAFDSAISTSVGLPEWVNHVAFDSSVAGIEARRTAWLSHGYDVVEVDHGFCISIYTVDPNGTLVEWCADTRPLDEQDRAHAERTVLDPAPALEEPPMPVFYEAKEFVAAG